MIRRDPPPAGRPCPNCGTFMRPPTRPEAFRRWFNNSGMAPLYRCERCGGMASGGALLYRSVHTAGPGRVFRWPIDVVAALRRERTWHPVPRFYAFVLGFALVPAALLAAVTGARRWLLGIPAAAWAVAFGWSMTTAFTSGRAGQAVREVVAPRRAHRRQIEREVAVARRALELLPAVVPVAWAGQLTIGGVSHSEPRRGEPRPHELSVIADQDGSLRSTPRLTIRVSAASEPMEDDELLLARFVAEELATPPRDRGGMDRDVAGADAEIASWRAEVDSLLEQQVRRLAEAWWPSEVRVDGAGVDVRAVTAGGSTLVRFELEGHPVTVTASGVELSGLALERVDDPGPLVAALERRLNQRPDPVGGRPLGLPWGRAVSRP